MNLSLLRKPFFRDENELRLRRERGQRAKDLLSDETLTEAFGRIEQVYMDAWRGSSLDDVKLRERTHIAVSLLSDLKNQLSSFIVDGKAAAEQLDKQLRSPPAQ